MRKVATVVVVIFVGLALGTYYYFSGKDYVFRFSEADLQSRLDDKLPLTKTYLFIIQITLDNPRVHLENGSNRVSAGLDVLFNITVNENSTALGGAADASGGVLYLPEKGQFFLTDPVVENLAVQGIPSKYLETVNAALTKALAEFYATHPLYTLNRIDAKQAAARLVLKDVAIENSELVVTLGI